MGTFFNGYCEKGVNMKISKNLKQLTTTQSEFGRMIGVTQPRVAQLYKSGIVEKDELGDVFVISSLQNYYAYKFNGDDTEELSFNTEKALHEKAKREIDEIKLAELRGDVHRTDDIAIMVGGLFTVFKKNVLAIPHKMAPLLECKNADDINEALTKEMEASLTELSQFDVTKIGTSGDDDDG